MLVFEVFVELVDSRSSLLLVLGGLVVLLVDLCERLVRLGVLQLHEARRQKGVGVNSTLTNDVVKVVLQESRRLVSAKASGTTAALTHVKDALLDEIFDRLGRFLGNDGDDLAGSLVLEVLVEQTVRRSVACLGFSLGRPVLDSNVLSFEGGNLG